MEQYQLVPLLAAVISLLGGIFTGMKLVQFPGAARFKPFAFAALILAIVFGTPMANWLTGALMVIVGQHWAAAILSITLLSFVSGVIFAFCGSAKSLAPQSRSETDRRNGDK